MQRGLMIDTGRNYLTPTVIKMAIDTMAYTKLNLLHWHIVDDECALPHIPPAIVRMPPSAWLVLLRLLLPRLRLVADPSPLCPVRSFPLQSKALPKLAGDGAFSPKHTYTLEDVSDIVAYAKERGVAVLPELDMPGHSTSWQRGYQQISSNCSSSGSGDLSAATASGFTTPMDPTANATYKLLDTLLEELDPLFPSAFPFWHLGGDEVQ